MKKISKKEPWTTDIREIERRMAQVGLLNGTLIHDAKDIKKAKKKGKRQ